jgi:hypothetical protein
MNSLNSDDDWIEDFRSFYYPKIHPLLNRVGGYGVGHVGENQYVGKVSTDEEALEEEICDIGFIRNPIACYKSTGDERESEGSWVLLEGDDPGDFIEPGYQLHITMFERRDGEDGREIYAHHEPDWRQTPFKHLYPGKYPGVTWETEKAAVYTKQLLDNDTFLDVRS